ncbi:MAG TPA: TetR/AcrR family transcriptional regulator [Roseiarcus sp.]|nr:TetR/AcrR family transcriptional regulator [Roseiarcus sp.]
MAKENAKQDGGDVAVEPPRERIVACAQDLFHRHGIRGVGVETIAEAAGTNKMTLYRHFGSKDDLVCEYLSRKGRKSDEIWADIEAASPGDPVGQLYGYIARAAKFIAQDERGCDLANAAVELTEAGHPGLRVIQEFKKRQRDRLARLCEAAGASQPGLLADTIVLLIEGARVSRRSVGTGGPSANLMRSSEAVIASFGVPARDKRHSRQRAARRPSRRGA